MTLTRDGLSTAADGRIRTFWILLWGLSILGFFAIAAGFALTFGTQYVQRPWDSANPVEATTDDGGKTWQGQGNAVLRLTEAEFGDQVLEVQMSGTYSVALYLSDQDETFGDDYFYPSYFASVYEDYPTVLLPQGRDLELWIDADEPWTLYLTPLEAQPIEDRLSGTGEGYVAYRGSATSARIEMAGDGIFGVTVLTPTEVGLRESEIDEYSKRLSWAPSDLVIFQITSSDPTVKWVIDIDLLADDSVPGSTPTPVPTPTVTPGVGEPTASAAPAASIAGLSRRPSTN